MVTPRRQPLSMGDLFDSAFRLYRAHFLRLSAIAIIVGAPMLLAQGLVSQWLLPRFAISLIWLTSFFGNLIITLIFGNLLSAVLVAAVAQAYHDQPISIGVAYRTGFQRYPLLVLASIVPLVNTIHTLFYYAVRERSEGYDLERNLAQVIS